MTEENATAFERTAQLLAETPISDNLLWILHWGSDENGQPSILQKMKSVLLRENGMASILVCGRYGVGKTSFLKALQNSITSSIKPRLEDQNDVTLLNLWLSMPQITNNQAIPADVAVISAIIERLCGHARNDNAEPPAGPRIKLDPKVCMELQTRLDDLWRFNEEGDARSATTEREPPRPCRMAGSGSVVSRNYRSSNLEEYIDYALGWDQSAPNEIGRMLVVYLDDVDRCNLHVPEALIRLLLRFRGAKSVRFVIACDRALMERGVERWMGANGVDDNGNIYVTANSSLEKYLDEIVIIPDLSCTPKQNVTPPQDYLLGRPLAEILEKLRDHKGGAEPILSTYHGDNASPILAEYLFTSLCRKLDEPVLIEAPPEISHPPTPDATEPPPEELPLEPQSIDPDDHAVNHSATGENRDQERKQNIGKNPAGENISKTDTNAEYSKTLLQKLTLIGRALHDLADIDPKARLLRLKPPHRDLGGALTPRQFKFYLRTCLSETLPMQMRPAEALLQQIFRPFKNMRDNEPELFRFVCAAAQSALAAAPLGGSSQTVPGLALKLFYGQLEATCRASVTLPLDGLAKAWPRQHDECVLLLKLLVATARETVNQPAVLERTTIGDNAALPPPSNVLLSVGDPKFVTWVEGIFHRKPNGNSVAAQVSSFQDIALEAYRSGRGGVAEAVVAYVATFLNAHMPFFDADSAASLSNLAVLINDSKGFEAACDRLFDAANKLSPDATNIALFYAEFLLDVRASQNRRASILQASYRDISALQGKISSLLPSSSRGLDRKQLFFAEILRIRLRCPIDDSDLNLDEELCDLVLRWAAFLLSSVKDQEATPISRLHGAIEALIGSSGANIKRKARILGLLWGAALKISPPIPAWEFVRRIANWYVGESETSSSEERFGCRMNVGLLLDPLSVDESSMGMIWTQTLSVTSRRMPKDHMSRRRVAMGLLVAYHAYGQDAAWSERADRAWANVGGKGRCTDKLLDAELEDADHVLLHTFLETEISSEKASSLVELVKFVFPDDADSPIVSIDQLASEEHWQDWDNVQQTIASIVDAYK